MSDDDTKPLDGATGIAAPITSGPKKPRKSYRYWGVYDGGTKATPEAAKQFVEESAQMLSDPAQGGRTVCIMKAPKGSTLGEETGVCYINGVRQVNRKRKK